ncbi:MAG: zinc-ribbon domain-containing protein, partial [Bacilli bacterium]|nr:zinc-ribbon domain-containing protein [Bacilli bacterium]
MKYCVYCGAQLSDEDLFCIKCGQKCLSLEELKEEALKEEQANSENARIEEEKRLEEEKRIEEEKRLEEERRK